MTLDDIKRRINRDVYDRPLAAILTHIVEMIGDRLVTAQGLVLEAEARAQAIADRCEEMDDEPARPEPGADVVRGLVERLRLSASSERTLYGGTAGDMLDEAADALSALDASPPADPAAIRDAALEEAANLADKLRHPDGYSSETEDWCEGTRHAARAIRALRSSGSGVRRRRPEGDRP